MTAPLPPLRTERGTVPRSAAATPRGAAAPAQDGSPDQQAQLAAQHAAFDFDQAERAELVREHEALESLIQEELKNDDEIMKKWIELA